MLTDVERIEVLKGPQGTLFGKNATAGVLYFVTRKPQLDEFSALGSLRYGSDNETVIEGNVNLPLSSNTAARLSAAYQQRDGYLPNKFNGIDGGAISGRFGAREVLVGAHGRLAGLSYRRVPGSQGRGHKRSRDHHQLADSCHADLHRPAPPCWISACFSARTASNLAPRIATMPTMTRRRSTSAQVRPRHG